MNNKVFQNYDHDRKYKFIYEYYGFNSVVEELITHKQDQYTPINQILYNSTKLYTNKSFDENNTRVEEILYAYADEGFTEISYSNTKFMKDSAIISIVRTIYVFVVVSYLK